MLSSSASLSSLSVGFPISWPLLLAPSSYIRKRLRCWSCGRAFCSGDGGARGYKAAAAAHPSVTRHRAHTPTRGKFTMVLLRNLLLGAALVAAATAFWATDENKYIKKFAMMKVSLKVYRKFTPQFWEDIYFLLRSLLEKLTSAKIRQLWYSILMQGQ